MDERIKKEEDIYLGVYHPYPKEAPKSWRMGRMKELRNQVLQKRKQKEKSMVTWIKNRIKEISTWSGLSLVVVGLLWIFAASLFNWVAYLAIAWGVYSIIKKQG
jgi:hypothetical protein